MSSCQLNVWVNFFVGTFANAGFPHQISYSFCVQVSVFWALLVLVQRFEDCLQSGKHSAMGDTISVGESLVSMNI